jgi:hypothetical protein
MRCIASLLWFFAAAGTLLAQGVSDEERARLEQLGGHQAWRRAIEQSNQEAFGRELRSRNEWMAVAGMIAVPVTLIILVVVLSRAKKGSGPADKAAPSSDASAVSARREPGEYGKMRCGRCGRAVTQYAVHCKGCGAALTDAEPGAAADGGA